MRIVENLARIIPGILLAGILLTGCSEKEETTDPTRVEARISAGIQTRAIDTKWEKDDCIGLHIFQNGTDNFVYNRYNYRYYTPEGSSLFKPNGDDIIYYPLDGSSIDFIGYYPYDADMESACVCKADVSDQTNLSAIDLMTSERFNGASRSTPEVTIKFHHRLSKLIFKAFYKDKVTELPIEKVEIQGMNTAASYSILTETLTVDDNSGKTLEAVSQDNKKVEAIVLPREAAEGVTFIITSAGSEFTAHLSEEQEFKSGFKYTFNLTLDDEHGSEPTIKAIIQEWIDGGEADVDSKLVTISNGPGEAIGFHSGDVITLYHEDMELTSFTYDETDWTPETPVYWENIGDGKSEDITLRAMFHRADALNGEQMPEVFLGETTTKRFESINLHFTLAPSKVVVKLTSDSQDADETFSDEELETASILLPSYISEYEIANGIFKEGATTGNINLVDGQALIVPQAITGTLAIITLNGNQYSVVQEEEQEFVAGKVYTITVNLLKSQLTPAFILSIDDWKDGDSIGIKGTPVNIELSGRTTDFKNGDEFTLYNGDKELTNYTFNDFVWNPDKNIYWEDLTEGSDGKIKLQARFIRHEELDEKQMPEVFLAATSCNRFEAVNLAFELGPAKIVVKLKSEGDKTKTFKAEELSNAKIELREYVTEYSIENGVFGKGATTGNIPVVNGAALIVPQTRNGELVSITINGNRYSVLQVAAQEFQAGKVYTITVNLLKSELSPAFNISYADWKPGDSLDRKSTPLNLFVSGNTATEFKSGNKFTLYNGNEELTTYEYSGSTWTPARPIYWEDLTEDSNGKIKLQARFIRQEELTENQMPEVFLAATSCNRFEAVNLAFELAPAKIVVKLRSEGDETNTFKTEELDDATIQLPAYLTGYSINAGVFDKGTESGTIALVDGIGHIVPQSKSGTLVEVILKGNKYIVSQTEAVNYQAGKIYTIKINLLKSDLTPAFNLSYTDWKDGVEIEEDGTPVAMSATPGTNGNFDDGAKIFLYHEKTQLATYTYNKVANTWTPNAPLYWEEIGDGNSPTLTLRAMYHRADALNSTQLPEVMLAEKEVTRFQSIQFHLELVPAKVIFELQTDGTFTEDELKNNTQILMRDYITGYTLEHGVFTPVPATRGNIEVKNFTALIVPQQKSGELAVLSLGGNQYKIEKSDGMNFEAGKAYKIIVKMAKTEVAFLSMSYTDWDEVGGPTLNATPVNLVVPSGTPTNFKDGNKIQLFDENGPLTTYTYSDTGWTPDAPIYWENIGDGSSEQVVLRGQFMREDAVDGTQLPEVFLAETTANRFQGVELDFELVPAKVVFVLNSVSDSGDNNQKFSISDLNGAVITLPGYNNKYTLTNGVYAAKTGTGDINVVDKEALIMPQNRDGVLANIVLNGNTYQVMATTLVEFTAGKVTTITVNLLKSGVGGISASYTDWTPDNGTNEFMVFAPTTSGTTSNFKDGDKMALYYDTESATDVKIGDFVYNETADKWSCTPAVYWEDLEQRSKYNFYAVSTLKTAPAGSNQMDDVMYAEHKNGDRFGAVNLAFTKKTARIVVVLKSNDGTFTKDELKDAVITLPGYKIGAKYNGLTYEAGTHDGNITLNATGTELTWSALIEPQDVAANDVIINISLKDDYQVKKNELVKFAIAKQYKYNINVSKSRVEFTADYQDWTPADDEDINIGLD